MRVPEPMYATIGTEVPTRPHWIFEQEYDGMRVIALVTARSVQLITRNGRAALGVGRWALGVNR